MAYPFFTRPNLHDRQVVQYSGTTLNLSGDTNINHTGNFRINKGAFPGLVATSLDSDGTVVWGPISGISWSISACTSPLYVNNLVSCPLSAGTIQVDAGALTLNSELQFLISLSAGTNNDNVLVIDNNGYVKSIPYVNGSNMWYVPFGYTLTVPDNYQSFIYGDLYVLGTIDLQTNAQLVVLNGNIILSGGSIIGSGTTQLVTLGIDTYVTGGTFNSSTGTLTLNRQNGSVSITGFTFNSTPFTGGTGSCITDLYVTNIHGCSPVNIQPTSPDDVYMVMGGGNIGIGTLNPIKKLHVSGDTRIEGDVNADVTLAVVNNNNGGISARASISTTAIADVSGRELSGLFVTSGYNTALFGFSDNGTGYLKNALSITLAGNVPRGDINIGTRDSGKFLRFFSGNVNFDNTALRGSLNSNGYWGFGGNMTGQTATVHIKGYSSVYGLKVDDNSNRPSLYVNSTGNVGVSVDPSYRFHVSGRTSNTELRYYDTTSLPSFDVVTNNDDDLTFINVRDTTANSTIALTVRGINEPVYSGYGKPGDASLYASVNINGLNIINHTGGGKEDYIRFYAGNDANNVSAIHIQGSGTTKGYVGLGDENPLTKLHVSGNTVLGSQVVFVSDVRPTQSDINAFLNNNRGFRIQYNFTGDSTISMANSNTSGRTGVVLGRGGGGGKNFSIQNNGDDYIRTAITPVNGFDFYKNKVVFQAGTNLDGIVFNLNLSGNDGRLWFEQNANSPMVIMGGGTPSDLRLGIALNPDGTEMPTSNLQIGGTGTTGTFKYRDGNQQNGYVLTSDSDGNATWQISTGSGTFTGNTSASCITDLYVTNVHGCSPITVWDSVQSNGSQATGTTSFAFGNQTQALGNYSHAEGVLTQAIGVASHAEGGSTIARSTNSHAEGLLTTAFGANSHAEGNVTIASGQSSHAEGVLTQAIGVASHAEGTNNIARGNNSHAEGGSTIAIGQSSHAEGIMTDAIGDGSHAEGGNTTAIGVVSHAEGSYTTSSGYGSHAGGSFSIAQGDYSFVHGSGSTAVGTSTIVLGDFITGNSSNTVYVSQLNIGTVGGGTPTINLSLDSNGFVVTGNATTTTFFTDNITTLATLDVNSYRVLYPFTASTSGEYIFDATTRVAIGGASPTGNITTRAVVNGTPVTSNYRTTQTSGEEVTHTEKKKLTLSAGDTFHYGVVGNTTNVLDGSMIIFKIS